MLLKCPICGGHVPGEVAVELPAGRYCSLRCAEEAEAQAGAPPPPVALPEAPKHLLVAVDGSGPSLRATELAATLAKLAGGRVTLLHAIDPGLLRLLPSERAVSAAARFGLRHEEVERTLREDAEAQLKRCRRVCEAAGVPVAARVELEPPVRAIAEAAADADLVVIGTRGLGAISGAAVGSVSHRLLGETRKPVLVVH
jgi:nucleotide-binding universal stress UspA family protein